jgi:hypothetical protein
VLDPVQAAPGEHSEQLRFAEGERRSVQRRNSRAPVSAGPRTRPPVAGLLGNSIGEAAFMTGMERNSDIVHLNSYAPLFANYNHTQWNPDLIGYDQTSSFGST